MCTVYTASPTAVVLFVLPLARPLLFDRFCKEGAGNSHSTYFFSATRPWFYAILLYQFHHAMQGKGNTLTPKNKTKNFTVVQNIPYLAVYQIP